MTALKTLLEERSAEGELDLVGAVLAVSRIPYGRPQDLSPDGVLAEWCGTCSTKHLLVAAIVTEAWPQLRPLLWHRVYGVDREEARSRWGEAVASVVPESGLVDVHTYATLEMDERRVRIDVTFPLSSWDGVSNIPLACGPGHDLPAGDDPLASKAAIVAARCDPVVRESFVAALARLAAREFGDQAARFGTTQRTPETRT